METEVIKPSKIFYGVSALIFITGVILFINFLITGISSTIDKINRQIVVPGTSIVELNETGRYTIYFESRSIVNGRVYENRSINGLNCSLKNIETGEYITLDNAFANSHYSVSGREGESLYDFVINKTGKYEIKGWYESGRNEEAVLAVGKGFFGALMRNILLSIGTLFISIGGSLGLFIFTLVMRQRYRKKISYYP